jgi:hypothetical protein
MDAAAPAAVSVVGVTSVETSVGVAVVVAGAARTVVGPGAETPTLQVTPVEARQPRRNTPQRHPMSGGAVTGPSCAAVPAQSATNKARRPRFDTLDPARCRQLAARGLTRWLKRNKNLNATLRLKHRIAKALQRMGTVLRFTFLLEEMKRYKWSTILQYTRIALALRPEERETSEMRSRLAELTALKNKDLIKREDPALTMRQLAAAIGRRQSVAEMAVWISWVTASRLGDWKATTPIFHADAIELRYVEQWKTDRSLDRRVVKWIPLGKDSPTRWRQACTRLKTPAGRASVIAHIMERTGRSHGHAIRHAAIRYLETCGVSEEKVSALTHHQVDPKSALRKHYMAKWSPRQALRSRICFRMAKMLREAFPSFE